ncbi:unnamed protein product [Brassica oleracea var. botrytis]|uniref:Uncharacterized protein n=2 Tax=Brassica oleracea TaxID=3712 RepID=A0A0D3ARK3_BRAOL|nr:unnamed protein product [Brassica oleracea]
MSVSSSSTSGRRRVRNAGIPTRYWCGVGITDVISKSTLNASRRYYGVFMRLEGSLWTTITSSNGSIKLSLKRYNSWTTKSES